MSLPPLSAGRILVLAGLIAVSLAACGRRGPLEAPLTSAELAAQQQRAQQGQQAQLASDDDDEDENGLRSPGLTPPVPTPRRRSRAIEKPKEPFILDPLL